MLTNADIAELTDLRRDLHRHPELSGAEHGTAARVAGLLRDLGADELRTGIGGTGVLAAFRGAEPGPSVMFRAELDALPITEADSLPHRSTVAGVAHLCGHDGHICGVLGLGRLLSRQRPQRGVVWLLFQPAEEDGSGAAAMLADARLPAFDYGFAIHNYPGLAQGQARLQAGVMNCASVGMRVRLTGATAHASEPEKARTPTLAVAVILPALLALSQGSPGAPGYRLVTITHLSMGVPAFGITPGEAEIWATLRTSTDEGMADLRQQAMQTVRDAAVDRGLAVDFDWQDDFAASVNDPQATALMAEAARAAGFQLSDADLPLRASEDFGRFGSRGRCAMIFLGAGADRPPLHAQDYDFPDDLIAPSVTLFHALARRLTG